MITLITTIIALIYNFQSYNLKKEWVPKLLNEHDHLKIYKKKYNDFVSKTQKRAIEKNKLKNLQWWFTFEQLLLVVCPVPYYETYVLMGARAQRTISFLLSDIILSIMMFRLYFPIKSAFNFSEYSDVYSQKICQCYGFEASFMYSFKCCLTKNSIVTAMVVNFGISSFYAQLWRIFEQPIQMIEDPNDKGGGFRTFFGSFYFTIITMTTVGYGDIVPGTTMGRIICIAITLTGFIIIPMIVMATMPHLSIEAEEKQAFHHINLLRKSAITI